MNRAEIQALMQQYDANPGDVELAPRLVGILREALESIGRAVWRDEEEDDDDFCLDRDTLLGMAGDVRGVLYCTGIAYENENEGETHSD